jgi:hypothetical protein
MISLALIPEFNNRWPVISGFVNAVFLVCWPFSVVVFNVALRAARNRLKYVIRIGLHPRRGTDSAHVALLMNPLHRVQPQPAAPMHVLETGVAVVVAARNAEESKTVSKALFP